jgi:serine/threonine-protein kinase PRP4
VLCPDQLVPTESYTVACTEVRAMDGDETTHLKDDNDSSSTGNYEAENKHDSSEVFAGKADFTVGKSPAHNDTLVSTGALSDERMIGVAGLGEGSPKVVVFC